MTGSRRRFVLWVGAACVALSFSLRAETAKPIDHGLNIVIAGHSFHVGMRAPLEEITQLAGVKDHRVVGFQFVGGSRTLQVWNVAEHANEAKKALTTKDVDVLTLSPHRLMPDEGIDLFTDLAFKRNPGIRVLVQKSWLAFDDPMCKTAPSKDVRNALTAEKLLEMHAPYAKEFADQITAVNKKYDHQVVFAVPTGPALLAFREKVRLGEVPGFKQPTDIFTDAMGHPCPALNILNAYVQFAVMYRRTPVGIPVPKFLKLQYGSESERLNTLLQTIAWKAVLDEPQSGVKQ